MEPGIWGVSDLGEGVFLLGKGPLVGFLGKIGISAKRTEGRGDFLEALRSDGGEGPIFLVEKGAEKPQRWGEF